MLRPMGSRVLVQRKKVEETTEAGIILPDKVVEETKETIGEVVAVGTGERLDNGTLRTPGVEVGEVVLFSEFAGTEVLFGGEEYLLMSAGEILAVIE